MEALFASNYKLSYLQGAIGKLKTNNPKPIMKYVKNIKKFNKNEKSQAKKALCDLFWKRIKGNTYRFTARIQYLSADDLSMTVRNIGDDRIDKYIFDGCYDPILSRYSCKDLIPLLKKRSNGERTRMGWFSWLAVPETPGHYSNSLARYVLSKFKPYLNCPLKERTDFLALVSIDIVVDVCSQQKLMDAKELIICFRKMMQSKNLDKYSPTLAAVVRPIFVQDIKIFRLNELGRIYANDLLPVDVDTRLIIDELKRRNAITKTELDTHKKKKETLRTNIKACGNDIEKNVNKIGELKRIAKEIRSHTDSFRNEYDTLITLNRDQVLNETLQSALTVKQKDKSMELRLKREINSLTKSNIAIKEVQSNLEKQIQDNQSDLKKENDVFKERGYLRNEVVECKVKDKSEIMIQQDTKQKQTSIDDVMGVHVNRLKEWNDLSNTLQKQFENRNDNDDAYDEKKEPNDSEKGSVLQILDLYTSCMKSLEELKHNSDDISEYVISLSKSKKELKNTVKEYSANRQSSQQTGDELCAQYANVKSQRQHLQAKVANMMKEVNRLTDDENEINTHKCKTLETVQVLTMEEQTYNELLGKCKSLSSKYKEFEKNVEQRTEEIQKYFGEKWDEHERLWTKWNVDDIICWIKYLIYDSKVKLSSDIDLKQVAKEMEMQKFMGKSLSKNEKNDLKLFGIIVFDDYQQIYERIKELIEKYPDISNDGEDVDDGIEGGIMVTQQTVTVPQEYLCPISGNIMANPVIYEGVTYDKSNFLDYVKQNGTIPGSDEQYDEDEDIFKNAKLKQKIDLFLSENPQFRNEGL
eukprot:1078607_1